MPYRRFPFLPVMAVILKVTAVLSFLYYWFIGVVGIIGVTQKIKEFTAQSSMMGGAQKLSFFDYVQAYQDPAKFLIFGLILLAGLWALANAFEALREIEFNTRQNAPQAIAEAPKAE